MKSIIAERIVHNGSSRIALKFPYDLELNSLIKSLSEARWSQTMNCWHIPDNPETIEKIVRALGEKTRIDASAIYSGSIDSMINNDTGGIDEFSREIRRNNCEGDPTISSEKEDAGDRSRLSDASGNLGSVVTGWKKGYDPVAFTINESDGKLIIRFTGRYDNEWIKELKSYGRVWFDPDHKEWLLCWSRLKVDSLSDYFGSRDVEVIVKKSVLPLPIKEHRHEKGIEIREREISTGTIKGIEVVKRFLSERRYSKNTVETYISLLELFFKYFSDKDPYNISEDDISDFFQDFIVYNNYSASYHNQLVSAIKMYCKLNSSSVVDTTALGRPRRGRSLPKVFSKEEVKLILNGSKNLKHRLILWMIYS